MGKSEPGGIGGKPRTPKLPNERKRQAEAARTKGPVVDPPETPPDNEFGDNSILLKDWRLIKTIIGLLVAQKRGGSGHHEKWEFAIEENASAAFIREKLDVAPVAICFHVTDNEFQAVKKEIYHVRILEAEIGKTVSSHMVLVVGYGYTKDGELFFLIQNSWGKLWGLNGYGRITIDDNSGATRAFAPPRKLTAMNYEPLVDHVWRSLLLP